MKIAYVYDAVHPWVTGGVQRRVWELARRLSTEHEVHWYGLKFWEGPSVRERDGVILHGVAEPPSDLYTDGRRSITAALSFAANLANPLDGARFDVIDCQQFPYFHCFPCKLAARYPDTAYLVTWHEVWGDYWNEYLGYKGVFGKLVERAVMHLPDAHVAVSDQTRRDLDGYGVRTADPIPNGIELERVERVPATEQSPDLLFAGRLIPEKNVDLLLDAIDALTETRPDVDCLIVGEGPEEQRLERQISALGLTENVTMLGFRESYDEILGLMKASDVFALPSRREGFGITVIEALACGTPVVTIDHPRNAARDLVDSGKTGFVSEPTPEAFANAVRAAGREIAERSCIESARKYDWDEITTQTENRYRTVA